MNPNDRLAALWNAIHRVARRLAAQHARPHTADDLHQIGALKVWLVLRSRASASDAYLLKTANNAMTLWLEEDLLIRVPRETRRLARQARRLIADEGLSAAEAAERVGLTAWTLAAVDRAESVGSLDALEPDVAEHARPIVRPRDGSLHAHRVRQVLLALPAPQREIIFAAFGFRDGEPRSTAALSGVLGCSKATAARRLASALAAFAAAWDGSLAA